MEGKTFTAFNISNKEINVFFAGTKFREFNQILEILRILYPRKLIYLRYCFLFKSFLFSEQSRVFYFIVLPVVFSRSVNSNLTEANDVIHLSY